MIRKQHMNVSRLALLVILIAAGTAQGADLKVCECQACGCQYLSIQEAINASSPGDTVLVRSGTFHGNINLSKPIVLRGEHWHGGDIPLINADGNGSCITVTADGAVVESIVVTNSGNASGDAGIRVVSNETTIRSNTARGNGGPGMILEGARNCTLSGNIAANNSRGICLLRSSDNLLFNNKLYNNTEFDAFDEGQNRWDDGSRGNYYGSFNCTDEDNDTICDLGFNISGGASFDAHPLVG